MNGAVLNVDSTASTTVHGRTLADSSGDDTVIQGTRAIVRHPHLYLEHEGGTVTLLVEQTLFRIHEYFLKRHSVVFSCMFTLDPGDSKLEGRSDELPVRLPDVQAVDFARLLSMFYPRDVVNGDLSTLEDWTSVLRITHLYDFEEHRKLAITRVEQLAGPIDRIILAREYDIPAWLEPAYCALVIREESLTLEEGTRLGMADVILIARMRHAVRGGLFIPSQQVSYYVRDSLLSAQARSTT